MWGKIINRFSTETMKELLTFVQQERQKIKDKTLEELNVLKAEIL
jgi:hypothetical protein